MSGSAGGTFSPQARSTLHARRYWMPDSQCKACTQCGAPFTFFRRKHHCRFCGKIYCQKCSSQEMDGRHFGDVGLVRVCDDCKKLESTMLAGGGSGSDDAPPSGSIPSPSPAGDSALGFMSGPHESKSQQQSAHSRQADAEDVADAAPRSSTSGAADAGGGTANATAAVDNLGGGGFTVDADYSVGIGIFDKRVRLKPPVAQQFNRPCTPASEVAFRGLAALAEAHLSWVVRRCVDAYIVDVIPGTTSSAAPPPSSALAAVESTLAFGPRRAVWADVITKLARRAAASVDPNIRAGERSDVRLFVKVKAVPVVSDAVFGGIKGSAAVAESSSSISSGGFLPPEAFKSSPDSAATASSADSCEFIDGVMFRRNLPHKGMRTDIAQPRVVLLDDAITFEGSTNSRLLSLETLLDQERRYTDILVSKLLALRPDVLFVRRNVSRIAQEMLLRGAVSVVVNTRLSSLQRLSRATGARILPSINYLDKLPETEIVGVLAGGFRVVSLTVPSSWMVSKRLVPPQPQQHALDLAIKGVAAGGKQLQQQPSGRVSYIVVDGCPVSLGCTLLLRGPAADLSAAKVILRHAVYVARSLRLQTAFHYDGCLVPRSGSVKAAVALARSGSALPTTSISDGPATPAVILPSSFSLLLASVFAGLGCPVSESLRSRLIRSVAGVPSSPDLDFGALVMTMVTAALDLVPKSLGADANTAPWGLLPALHMLLGNGAAPAALQSYASTSTSAHSGYEWLVGSAASDGDFDALPAAAAASSSLKPLPLPPPIAVSPGSLSAVLKSCTASSGPDSVLPVTFAGESILLSSCRISEGVQCFKPKLRLLKFYSSSDPSLGQYLESSCLDESRACKACRRGPQAHTLSYFHHRGRLDVSMVRFSHPIPLIPPQPQPVAVSVAAIQQQQHQHANQGAPTSSALSAALTGGSRSASSDNAAAAATAAAAALVSAGGGIVPPLPPQHSNSSGALVTPFSSAAAASAPGVSRSIGGASSSVSVALPSTAPGGPSNASSSSSSALPGPPPQHVLPQPMPPLPGTDIVTWSVCLHCRRLVSPPTRLSRNAWSLSFGKFLELAFYNHSLVSADFTGCPHPPHTSHVRYFARGRVAAVMRYTQILPVTLRVQSAGPATIGATAITTGLFSSDAGASGAAADAALKPLPAMAMALPSSRPHDVALPWSRVETAAGEILGLAAAKTASLRSALRELQAVSTAAEKTYALLMPVQLTRDNTNINGVRPGAAAPPTSTLVGAAPQASSTSAGASGGVSTAASSTFEKPLSSSPFTENHPGGVSVSSQDQPRRPSHLRYGLAIPPPVEGGLTAVPLPVEAFEAADEDGGASSTAVNRGDPHPSDEESLAAASSLPRASSPLNKVDGGPLTLLVPPSTPRHAMTPLLAETGSAAVGSGRRTVTSLGGGLSPSRSSSDTPSSAATATALSYQPPSSPAVFDESSSAVSSTSASSSLPSPFAALQSTPSLHNKTGAATAAVAQQAMLLDDELALLEPTTVASQNFNLGSDAVSVTAASAAAAVTSTATRGATFVAGSPPPHTHAPPQLQLQQGTPLGLRSPSPHVSLLQPSAAGLLQVGPQPPQQQQQQLPAIGSQNATAAASAAMTGVRRTAAELNVLLTAVSTAHEVLVRTISDILSCAPDSASTSSPIASNAQHQLQLASSAQRQLQLQRADLLDVFCARREWVLRIRAVEDQLHRLPPLLLRHASTVTNAIASLSQNAASSSSNLSSHHQHHHQGGGSSSGSNSSSSSNSNSSSEPLTVPAPAAAATVLQTANAAADVIAYPYAIHQQQQQHVRLSRSSAAALLQVEVLSPSSAPDAQSTPIEPAPGTITAARRSEHSTSTGTIGLTSSSSSTSTPVLDSDTVHAAATAAPSALAAGVAPCETTTTAVVLHSEEEGNIARPSALSATAETFPGREPAAAHAADPTSTDPAVGKQATSRHSSFSTSTATMSNPGGMQSPASATTTTMIAPSRASSSSLTSAAASTAVDGSSGTAQVDIGLLPPPAASTSASASVPPAQKQQQQLLEDGQSALRSLRSSIHRAADMSGLSLLPPPPTPLPPGGKGGSGSSSSAQVQQQALLQHMHTGQQAAPPFPYAQTYVYFPASSTGGPHHLSAGGDAQVSGSVASLFVRGHLALPPGIEGVVVPVDAELTSTLIAYSLSATLYWQKLSETVAAACERLNQRARESGAVNGPYSGSGGGGGSFAYEKTAPSAPAAAAAAPHSSGANPPLKSPKPLPSTPGSPTSSPASMKSSTSSSSSSVPTISGALLGPPALSSHSSATAASSGGVPLQQAAVSGGGGDPTAPFSSGSSSTSSLSSGSGSTSGQGNASSSSGSGGSSSSNAGASASGGVGVPSRLVGTSLGAGFSAAASSILRGGNRPFLMGASSSSSSPAVADADDEDAGGGGGDEDDEGEVAFPEEDDEDEGAADDDDDEGGDDDADRIEVEENPDDDPTLLGDENNAMTVSEVLLASGGTTGGGVSSLSDNVGSAAPLSSLDSTDSSRRGGGGWGGSVGITERSPSGERRVSGAGSDSTGWGVGVSIASERRTALKQQQQQQGRPRAPSQSRRRGSSGLTSSAAPAVSTSDQRSFSGTGDQRSYSGERRGRDSRSGASTPTGDENLIEDDGRGSGADSLKRRVSGAAAAASPSGSYNESTAAVTTAPRATRVTSTSISGKATASSPTVVDPSSSTSTNANVNSNTSSHPIDADNTSDTPEGDGTRRGKVSWTWSSNELHALSMTIPAPTSLNSEDHLGATFSGSPLLEDESRQQHLDAAAAKTLTTSDDLNAALTSSSSLPSATDSGGSTSAAAAAASLTAARKSSSASSSVGAADDAHPHPHHFPALQLRSVGSAVVSLFSLPRSIRSSSGGSNGSGGGGPPESRRMSEEDVAEALLADAQSVAEAAVEEAEASSRVQVEVSDAADGSPLSLGGASAGTATSRSGRTLSGGLLEFAARHGLANLSSRVSAAGTQLMSRVTGPTAAAAAAVASQQQQQQHGTSARPPSGRRGSASFNPGSEQALIIAPRSRRGSDGSSSSGGGVQSHGGDDGAGVSSSSPRATNNRTEGLTTSPPTCAQLQHAGGHHHHHQSVSAMAPISVTANPDAAASATALFSYPVHDNDGDVGSILGESGASVGASNEAAAAVGATTPNAAKLSSGRSFRASSVSATPSPVTSPKEVAAAARQGVSSMRVIAGSSSGRPLSLASGAVVAAGAVVDSSAAAAAAAQLHVLPSHGGSSSSGGFAAATTANSQPAARGHDLPSAAMPTTTTATTTATAAAVTAHANGATSTAVGDTSKQPPLRSSPSLPRSLRPTASATSADASDAAASTGAVSPVFDASIGTGAAARLPPQSPFSSSSSSSSSASVAGPPAHVAAAALSPKPFLPVAAATPPTPPLPGGFKQSPARASAAPGAFGHRLPLSPAAMLGSDVKADIVHTFADKSSPTQWLPASVLGSAGDGMTAEAALTPPPPSSFSVTSYWAMHFHALREMCLGGAQRAFVASLATSSKWSASGGKSGARFERSSDRRFVTKHISKTEFDMFITHVAPAYFAHMRSSLLDGIPSVLVRIHGVFKVVASTHSRVTRPAGGGGLLLGGGAGGAGGGAGGSGGASSLSGGSSGGIGMIGGGGGGGNNSGGIVRKTTYYVLVMDDLFFNCNIPAGLKFDLKGKSRAQKRPAAARGATAGVNSFLLSPSFPFYPSQQPREHAVTTIAPPAPVLMGEDLNPFNNAPATAATTSTSGASSSGSTPAVSASVPVISMEAWLSAAGPGAAAAAPPATPVFARGSSAGEMLSSSSSSLSSSVARSSSSELPVQTPSASSSSSSAVIAAGARGLIETPMTPSSGGVATSIAPVSATSSTAGVVGLTAGYSGALSASASDAHETRPTSTANADASVTPGRSVVAPSIAAVVLDSGGTNSSGVPPAGAPAATLPAAAFAPPQPQPNAAALVPASMNAQQQQQQMVAGVADDTVLLDGDFLAYTRGLPLPLTDDSKRLLDECVRRDTEFLCRTNVVDYSLLIGIDPASGMLHVGIIDYIRRFDLAKQLESRVKTVTSLATNVEPTVIQPERYLERLQRALDRYFILVPQKWTSPSAK